MAEEALAIAVYCALFAPTFRVGVLLAVNHGGDSDSTGAMAGNLLGTALGASAIDEDLLAGLEGRAVIEQVAADQGPSRPRSSRLSAVSALVAASPSDATPGVSGSLPLASATAILGFGNPGAHEEAFPSRPGGPPGFLGTRSLYTGNAGGTLIPCGCPGEPAMVARTGVRPRSPPPRRGACSGR